MSDTSDTDTAVEIILERACPKHIEGGMREELKGLLRAMISICQFLLENGTGDKEMTDLYEKVRDKFCALYPRHLYPSLHEYLRTAIQSPDEIVHHSPAHKFGMSKTRLKRHKAQYAQYMRTCEFQCRQCCETKSGTEYSDRRLVGRRKRRVCNDCIEGGGVGGVVPVVPRHT